jgi:hypothetical protein
MKERFNHDRSIDSKATKALLTNCTYLEDSGVVVEGYWIWGSPWSPRFFDWGFNADRGQQIEQYWNLIPPDTEVLITHGPPKDILDNCMDGFHAGCEVLAAKINQIKPLVHLFGHIHEAYGYEFRDDVLYINGSN